jgi:hypothetical protein
MGKSLTMKIMSAMAVGIVLAHLSPIAAGMLLCVGDGTAPDCCPGPDASQVRLDEPMQLADGSDCGCCITIGAAPSTAGATSKMAPLSISSGSDLPRSGTAVPPRGAFLAHSEGHDPGHSRRSSLRSVVLLI